MAESHLGRKVETWQKTLAVIDVCLQEAYKVDRSLMWELLNHRFRGFLHSNPEYFNEMQEHIQSDGRKKKTAA